MQKSNNLINNTPRVDSHALLAMLNHIANNQCGVTDLCKLLNLSPATIKRLISNCPVQYGVVITHKRGRGYVVHDWGVFDRDRVIEFCA